MASRDLCDSGSGDAGAGQVPALDQMFEQDGLYALRAAVSAHAVELGATERRMEDLVVVANELASNAIRHGGGGGRLCLWRHGRSIVCQVTDVGPGLPEPAEAGQRRPPVSLPGGRGLWIVRQLAQHLDVHTGPGGTRVTATVGLDHLAH